MSDNTAVYTFTSATNGEQVSWTLRRSLLSDEKFAAFMQRFAPDEKSRALVSNFCYLVGHVSEATNSPGLPLRMDASDDEFWSAYENTLALFDTYDGIADAIDAIPRRLPHESDPVKKHDAELTPSEAAEVADGQALEDAGQALPEKN